MKDKSKKKFGDTAVGKILDAGLGLINPALGGIINQSGDDVPGLLNIIKGLTIPSEDKVRAQEMVLEAYEAEVQDRVAARQREAIVAASGGSDILFKSVGWGITLAFLVVVAAAVGLWDIPEESQRLFDMGFGAVVAAFTQVIGYYFGSSMGSKQKTDLMRQ